jgi:hypothetical protein
MDWLEQELRQALARKDPPSGADFSLRLTSVRPWLAAAAALIVAAGGTLSWREHQGRIAKEQVMTAMRITSARLSHIQTHVREVRP